MGLGLGSRSHGALRPHDVDLARGEQARRAEVEVVLDTVLPEDGVAGVLAAVDTRHDLDLGAVRVRVRVRGGVVRGGPCPSPNSLGPHPHLSPSPSPKP